MLEAWQKQLSKPTPITYTWRGQTRTKTRKLSPRSVLVAHIVFKAALTQAVRWQLLDRNPFDGVRRPATGKLARGVWTKEQAAKFLNTARDHPLYALYLIVIMTGLRRGEILGLRWQDVNFNENTIKIEQSLIFVNGKRTLKHGVKTESSERKFTVSSEIIDALREREGAQILERANAGEQWQETGLIFTTTTGTGIYESTLRRIHTKLIAQADVPNLTLHPLRRTFTSLAILSGADIKEVSRRLGHSSVEITLDIYQQLYPEQDQKAAFSSTELLGVKLEPKNSAGVKDGSKQKPEPTTNN
jgi:integrase